jgi:hypothetical protein
MERDHGPVTVIILYDIILYEETRRRGLVPLLQHFFRSVRTIASPVGSRARRKAPAGNTRGDRLMLAAILTQIRRVIQARRES